MKPWMLWAIVIAYWIWPIDLIPGNPIDDIVIVALAYYREEVAAYLKGLLEHA
ncbi:MAG TPA: hypothetical protein VLA24_09295 [Pseudomonadales bacterium]|nr:hypothetical protein [Pseudomonadales bacterium]